LCGFSIVFASVMFFIEFSSGEGESGGADGIAMVLRLVPLLRVLKLPKAFVLSSSWICTSSPLLA